MLRKFICFLLAVGLACVTAGEGRAAEQTGTVRVIPVWCGQPVAGGKISLRFLGKKVEGGIQVTDGLANWILEEKDLLSEDWQRWILQGSGSVEYIGILEDDTGAEFTDLQGGIYLVRQLESGEEYFSFRPFLLDVPQGDAWEIIRKPDVVSRGESPRTADRPAPIVGAMGIGFSVAVLMVLADGRKK